MKWNIEMMLNESVRKLQNEREWERGNEILGGWERGKEMKV